MPVTDFAADHKGMGRFMLLPAAGESYQALPSFADGSTKPYLQDIKRNFKNYLLTGGVT